LSKKKDTYEIWLLQEVAEKKLKVIRELVSKQVSLTQISKTLGITPKTLIKLKNVHSEVLKAFVYGNEDMKDNLIGAMYKKAIGFEQEEVQTFIEENNHNKSIKRKIVKNKKYYPPDYSAIRYLLITKFGREYNEKKDEIYLMEKRIENNSEVWINEE
jgi:isopropylmalate/homocitrate/citramalate synthase